MPIGHPYVFFGEMLGSLPIFQLGCFLLLLLLSCLSYLHILEIRPLSVALLAKIFSHFVGCLFILFRVSFAGKKLLSLVKSHLFTFVFIFITLGSDLRRCCCGLCWRVFGLCFPLRLL